MCFMDPGSLERCAMEVMKQGRLGTIATGDGRNNFYPSNQKHSGVMTHVQQMLS